MKQIINTFFLIDFFRNIKFFYNWYKKGFISPAPNFVKHKIIGNFLIKDSIFIETGTNEGKTLRKLYKNFSYSYSIEPSDFYYNLSKKNLSDLSNKIELVHSTSEDSLEKILLKCKNNDVTFFLDGHYSGKNTYHGKTDTPIEFEIKLILKHLKFFKNIVVVIDDFRCFEKENYPNKNFLVNLAYENNLFFTIEHDMFIISSIIKFKK
jgi:hypothetical protein